MQALYNNATLNTVFNTGQTLFHKISLNEPPSVNPESPRGAPGIGALRRLAATLLLVILGVAALALLQGGGGSGAPQRPVEAPVGEATESPPPQPPPAAETPPAEAVSGEAAAAGVGPGYLLSVEPRIVVAPPGSRFTLNLGLEASEGFSGSVEVVLAGAFYYRGGFITEPPRALVLDGVFSMERVALAPGGEAEAVVAVSEDAPPGSYLLALQPVHKGSPGGSVLVNVFVPAVPGYAIVPEPPEGPVEPFQDVVVRLRVMPVGGYQGEVLLNVDYRGVKLVSLEPRRGTPPFTAELVFRLESYETVCGEDGECRSVEADPWRGLEEGGVSNANRFILVTATGPGAPPARAIILVGLEEPPRRPGILETLFNILLFPLYLALSVSLSTVTGAALTPLAAAAPVPTVYLEAGAAALEPYKLLAPQQAQQAPGGDAGGPLEPGEHWLRTATVRRDGGYTSVLRLAAVSEAKPASIMVASPRIVGSAAIWVYAPEAGDVELRLYSKDGRKAPAELEVTSRAGGLVEAVIRSRSPEITTVILEAVAEGRVLDRVELDLVPPPSPQPYTIVFAEPGDTVVAAVPLPKGFLVYPQSLEQLDPWVERLEPRSAGAGPLQLAVYTQYYTIHYYYPAPGGGYQKQGEETREIPGAGRIDYRRLLDHMTVAQQDGFTIVELRLSGDAEPGMYLVRVSPPPHYYVISLAIIVSWPPDPSELEPLIVKEYVDSTG